MRSASSAGGRGMPPGRPKLPRGEYCTWIEEIRSSQPTSFRLRMSASNRDERPWNRTSLYSVTSAPPKTRIEENLVVHVLWHRRNVVAGSRTKVLAAEIRVLVKTGALARQVAVSPP